MNESKLRKAVKQKNIFWHRHSLERMLERGISRKDAISVLLKGEIIEDYKNNKPFPSALIFGWIDEKPLHVVAALDENNDICHVITVYHPDEMHFSPDFKTRRKK